MKQSQNRSSDCLPDHLRRVVTAEFGADQRACELFWKFLQARSYRRSFSLELLAVGQGKTCDGWNLRRLAILMLEREVLRLPAEEAAEYEFLFAQLHLKSNAEPPEKVKDSVLKEGYSTTTLPGFIAEFRQRLERLRPIHNRLAGRRTSQTALRNFIRQSRQECQLTLARYCFTPAEVITQIRQHLRLSRGVKDLDCFDPSSDARLLRQEVTSALAGLPDYEAAILKGLCRQSGIYWVSGATGSELNSLVEYPLTTVVVVIKPPGSQIEFEIKRTGRKGEHPLNVVFRRDGKEVPIPHYLDGGSMGKQLGFEARSGCRFSHLYRAVHNCEPPLSSMYSVSTIYTVPASHGEEHLLSYFTEPQAFGDGFGQMRRAMKEVVKGLQESNELEAEELPGDLGLTVQFLGFMEPAQAILAGSSSFRLDRLAAYLTGQGSKKYFKQGLNVPYTSSDARWLADELLREILPHYAPPTVRNCSYQEYVTEAFRANRACANDAYLSVVRQLGVCWGTLMGAGGCSWGESFVNRNVGLKGYWKGGQWQIKFISMDHDNLFLNGYEAGNFHPLEAVQGMLKDEKFIWGNAPVAKPVVGTMTRLGDIYRVEGNIAAEGTQQFHQALKEAYRKTQIELAGNPELQRIFSDSFVEQVCYWNQVVKGYLKAKCRSGSLDNWRKEMGKLLTKKWKLPLLSEEYLKAAEEHGDFLERYSFLYQH